jgi:hypothetical protein
MQDKISELIDFLRDREGLFIVLVGALFVQAPHSAEVFHRISTSQWWAIVSWVHSAGFAIVLELAVLLFVVRGRTKLSWSFAGISVLMNVFYYYSPLWWSTPTIVWSDIVKCVVTSIALPLAIAFYSHEVAKQDTQPAKQTAQSDKQNVQDVQTDIAQTDNMFGQNVQSESEIVRAENAQSGQPADDATIDKRQRATQLRSEGLSYAQIASELDVHRNTIANWLKATNGHTAEVAQ